MRMKPARRPSGPCSMLTLTSASSPNTLFAYRLAARKPHSPVSALGGVRHLMLVAATMWSKNAFTSVITVFTATCAQPSVAGAAAALACCCKDFPGQFLADHAETVSTECVWVS